jgi:hypothetical protein
VSIRLAGALVTHERTLETREPSCMPRAAKPFFIPIIYGPLKAVGYVAASEPSPLGGRVRSREARGSAGVLPCEEARSKAEGHVVALEPTSTWR